MNFSTTFISNQLFSVFKGIQDSIYFAFDNIPFKIWTFPFFTDTKIESRNLKMKTSDKLNEIHCKYFQKKQKKENKLRIKVFNVETFQEESINWININMSN